MQYLNVIVLLTKDKVEYLFYNYINARAIGTFERLYWISIAVARLMMEKKSVLNKFSIGITRVFQNYTLWICKNNLNQLIPRLLLLNIYVESLVVSEFSCLLADISSPEISNIIR